MVNDDTAIGDVIDGMYAMISGPAGPRDWARQAQLFHPDARQMRTGVGEDGKPWIAIMGLEQYRRDTQPFFDTGPFFEVELARRVQVFGNMAHVWSHYEARRDPLDLVPERRGVNSIQLFKGEDGAWKIISMIWDNERPGLSLPTL
ncbi:hypothetical protein [Caulobacter sp. NIBR1757]|uniref:hypothetical protein n=1 Tax=Caulobacter sp. NIBR1757 TaxID=3016000 RepID=UPI0022F03416|nr:hypothetical protein [Caulobacter sp. NIBR1757]WGM39095.1 hypothetical protein AMEJIAPC_02008 [Caulobacter sp. NIBR1757]